METRRYTDLVLFKRLLGLARPFWPHIVGIFLLDLLKGSVVILNPVPLKIAIDCVIPKEPRPLPSFLSAVTPAWIQDSKTAVLVLACLMLMTIPLLSKVQALATQMLTLVTGEKLILGFQAQLFRHATRLSLAYHDAKGTADAAYRIKNDAPAIKYIAIDGVSPFVTAAITLCTMLYITIRLDWELALIALTISPVLFFVAKVYRRRMRKVSHTVKEAESGTFSVVQEVLTSLRVVKAFGQEEREKERMVKKSQEGIAARIHMMLSGSRFSMINGTATALATATVLFVGVRHVQDGTLLLGDLTLMLGYIAQLYSPLKTLTNKGTSLQSHLASAERAFALLDEAPDVAEKPDARPLARASGAVAFKNVSFAYGQDPPVLREVTFEVPTGTRVGIAGTTGAGKTTLVSLLTRFFDPTAGEILLDGVDLRDYKLADLRSQFAIVLQDSVLFSTSIEDNIAYARPGAEMADIIEAAKAADAHNFISSLPDGYQTKVGERGMRLSGGERQRIALARAFLKRAPILILDEPTSSVDVKTEASILEAMERLMRGGTAFMIAHRLSTLQNCDVVLKIEQGQLVEMVKSAGRTALPAGGSAEAENQEPIPSTLPSSPGAGSVHPPGSEPSVVTAQATDPQEHPAYQAWSALGPGHPLPENIERLGRKRKSTVFRLSGVGRGGTAVVGKRCKRESAVIERTVYGEILPRLSISSLHYYGSVDDPDSNFAWIFIEDAGGKEHAPQPELHGALIARWLGLLHAGAAGLPAAARLPERGPGHYFEHLHSGREMILRNLGNPLLRTEDLKVLEAIVSQCDFIEARRSQIESFCESMPRTLVHGDFVSKNMRLRARQEANELLLFDWETAGWGSPAADLAEIALNPQGSPDIALYASLVREAWPGIDRGDLEQLAAWGKVFRLLAMISWESLQLPHSRVRSAMGSMRYYQTEMAQALRSQGWEEVEQGACNAS